MTQLAAPRAETRIGSYKVARIGYGAALRVAGRPGSARTLPDLPAVTRLLRHAIELGVGLIDTADSYGPELSEALIAGALHPYPPGLLVGTKGGVRRDADGQTLLDARPERLRAACEASLQRLRLEAIGLYQLHWPDPAIPFAEQVGALAELVRAGKVRHVGLCNVTPAQLDEAVRIMPVAAVQQRFGLGHVDGAALLARAAHHGAAFIAHGCLDVLRDGSATRAANLAAVARRLGATPAQVALAWLLRQAPGALAIPGTLSIAHLEQNVGAAGLVLADADMAALDGPARAGHG